MSSDAKDADRLSAEPAASTVTKTASDLTGWLMTDACYRADVGGLLEALAKRLQEFDIGIVRIVAHLRTLNPEFRGFSVSWSQAGIERKDREHGIEHTPVFAGSPL